MAVKGLKRLFERRHSALILRNHFNIYIFWDIFNIPDGCLSVISKDMHSGQTLKRHCVTVIKAEVNHGACDGLTHCWINAGQRLRRGPSINFTLRQRFLFAGRALRSVIQIMTTRLRLNARTRDTWPLNCHFLSNSLFKVSRIGKEPTIYQNTVTINSRASVAEGCPTLSHHWVNVYCLQVFRWVISQLTRCIEPMFV